MNQSEQNNNTEENNLIQNKYIKQNNLAERNALFEQRRNLALRIWQKCQMELGIEFPFLNRVRYQLEEMSDATKSFECLAFCWTDGKTLYYHIEKIIEAFSSRGMQIKWDIMHTILHCIYLHPSFVAQSDIEKWNLSCDLYVEMILEQLCDGRDERRKADVYHNCIDYFKRHQILTVYQMYEFWQGSMQSLPGFDLESVKKCLVFDDHEKWRHDHYHDRNLIVAWKTIEKELNGTLISRNRRRGSATSGISEYMERSGCGRYDYRRFLSKFMFTREEVETDLNSFDYIYYMLGMERYEHIPLIEHLEYKEVNRMEQLVIAIDTSGSCDRNIVQQFLEETYRILSSRENFFKKMLVYVIQCDCSVQDVAILRNEEDWKTFYKRIRIQGRGGTDFGPVFRYVEQQQKNRKLKNLKALIYFTDGDGVYPDNKTPYETAFVFLKENEHMKKVPSWAKTLVVRGQR